MVDKATPGALLGRALRWARRERYSESDAGRAYGAAFRAVELAYELGQRHERERIALALRREQRTCITAAMRLACGVVAELIEADDL